MGQKGLRLKTRATGAAVNDCNGVYRHACHGPAPYMRYRGALCFALDGVAAHVWLWLFFVNGAYRWKAGVCMHANGRVDRWCNDGYGRELTALQSITTHNSWNYFDLVLDVPGHKYHSLAVNGQRLSLVGDEYEALQQYGDWDDTSLALDLILYADTANAAEVYIDQLLVTPLALPV